MKNIIYFLVSILVLSCSTHKKVVLPSTQQLVEARPSYRLQVGDKVELLVTQRQDLSGEYRIGPDGSLALPLAGNIDLENLTREQAEVKIKSTLEKYYSPISLILKIKSYQSNAFFVIMGEVNEPGVYPIINQISFLKALGTAKGLKEDAAIENIQLIRNASEKQVIKINLKDIMQRGDFSQDYILEKDDLIYIPRRALSSWMYPLKQILPVVQVGLLTLITVNQLP